MNEQDPRILMDPYEVLGISYMASEKEIQQAFHKKMGQATDQEQAIQAYGMIRDASGRHRFLYEDVRSFLRDPTIDAADETLDMDALARELAFLSTWETGDDTCLN